MKSAKKLGIIGGMGSRAGVLLLKKIIDNSPADTDQEFPEIIFHNNSLVPDRTRAIIYNEPSPLPGILKSVEMFNNQGVDVMALACITSYYYYNDIKKYAFAKVISPFQLIADCIRQQYGSAKRVGLLATTGTIQTGLFHDELKTLHKTIITLDPGSQEEIFMRSVYMKNGFKSAHISDEAWMLMNLAIDKLFELGADVIIGGCTEVSIASAVNTGRPLLDACDLLAKELIDQCYNTESKLLKDKVYG